MIRKEKLVKDFIIKNKKSQLFILISIFILILFLTSYEIYSITQDRETVRRRVETMDSYVSSLDKDLSRLLYVFGFRFLFVSQKYIIENGKYMNDVTDIFQEAFFNSTFYGNQSDILEGAGFEGIVEAVNNNAGKINLEVNITTINVMITQEDPWHVAITFSVNLTVKDKSEIASWTKQENVTAYVSIEQFEDPFFVINSGGKVTRKINKTIYGFENIVNLSNHLNNDNYIANSDAPSFLKRLEGNFSADVNGVESFVDLQEFSDQGISTRDKSVVDHVYFSIIDPASCRISGMPSWFKIDSEHLVVYNVAC